MADSRAHQLERRGGATRLVSPTGPSLYGLENLNKDLAIAGSWGKNQFNNLFPMSLACYMRDHGIPMPYLKLGSGGNLSYTDTDVGEVFGSELSNRDLYFAFESKFKPFLRFLSDPLVSIDVVIRSKASQEDLRPLEVKLTTLPDNTTKDGRDEDYGSEIVVRDKTTRYLALSIADACEQYFQDIHAHFAPCCQHIRDWQNLAEMSNLLVGLIAALKEFLERYARWQRPLLLQPIWKTVGQSSEFAEDCLDIFAWSDFALTSLFMTGAQKIQKGKISRPQRAALRLVRFLWEVSSGNPVFQAPIYDDMTFGTLNDKEFSIAGKQTNRLMKHPRLTRPHFTKDILQEVILGGGETFLSPERRLDAAIFYTLGSLRR